MFEQYLSDKITEEGGEDNLQLARGSIFNKSWLENIPSCLYTPEGNMLSGYVNDSEENKNDDKDKMMDHAKDGKISYRIVENTVYFYSPLKYKDNIIAILELRYSVKDRTVFYNSIKQMFYITGFISLISGLILCIVYFSRFTKDIYEMRDYVNNIKQGKFNNENKVDRNDELGELNQGFISMSRTIETNLKELKDERDSLSHAVEKLKKMDKAQKEFINSVTHEFKTPITAIKAYGDLIGMYPDDLDLIEDGTKKISNECDRISDLVENVLELSAMEKYDFEIEKKIINLGELLKEICNRLSGRIKRNNLTLNCNFEDIMINGDEESIKHILINLIDNSIKYNKINGKIDVSCYGKGDTACVEISDSGIGIPREHINKIFEPFYRVDKHRSRESGGNGLGLSLVKKLMLKQNGNIKVESAIGKGSTFILEFKLYQNNK